MEYSIFRRIEKRQRSLKSTERKQLEMLEENQAGGDYGSQEKNRFQGYGQFY